jgi:hypothetical protein
MTDKDLAITDAMEQYGGSFVKALAVAARRADPDNLAKIKATWPEYWQRYTEMVEMPQPTSVSKVTVRSNLGRNYFEFGRFRFIGRDGSMGYRTGKVYTLQRVHIFRHGESTTTVFYARRTGLQRLLHGEGRTPYENQQAFDNNWEPAE